MVLSGISILFQGINIERLLIGLFQGVKIAVASVVIGMLIGLLLGILRINGPFWVKGILKLYLELFRIIPLLVWLYVLFYILPADYELHLSAVMVSIIVFSAWVAAEFSDLVRSALVSLPAHQRESGMALGLSEGQLYRYILLPQALKRLIPGSINLVTRVIKTTSITVMIGVIDVIKVGQQIIEANNTKAPTTSFWIYGVIFLLYFLLSYPLSKLAQSLERRWNVEEGNEV